MQKRMREDPSQEEFFQRWSAIYQPANYGSGMAGYFLGKSHDWCEAPFGPGTSFPRVLEVGAGTGEHLHHVQHGFDEYWVTDANEVMLDRTPPYRLRSNQLRVVKARENAARLSFEDSGFDRVVAAHILEHLERPHEVLREWTRVLKAGGVLSIVLPCDPGVLWRLGRYASARKKFIDAGIDYDYWLAREHINPITNLVSLLRHYFPQLEESWLPFRVPLVDVNFFYIAHIRV